MKPTIFLNNVTPLSDIVKDQRKLTIRLTTDRTTSSDLKKMKDLFLSRPGACDITLAITTTEGAEAIVLLGKEYRVEVGDPLLAGLERVFGEQVAELR